MAATAALALSSCSSDELVQGPEVEEGGVPVAFDSYMGRDSRAGNTILTDVETDDGILAKGIKKFGFGVYGYEQGTDYIEDYTNKTIVPNFFLNEKVAWNYDTDNPRFAYGRDLKADANSGVKYWPNNPGAMLSFYAYAAYNEKLDHQPTTDPCRLIYNGAYNGPAIQYTMPADLTKAVDLCWGEDNTNPGKAPVNKTKPTIENKVSFNFKHAMARYGFNVQVWSDQLTDNPEHNNPNLTTNNEIKDGTTINIKSVKLAGNFATTGVLRLYDGTWDAQTALTGEYELKPNFGQKVREGLDKGDAISEIPLLGDATSDNNNLYVMMIPGAKFQIVIEYDVETIDDKLGGKVITHNKLTSPAVYTAEAGVATDFHLNLGMTTVKFDATVTPWNIPANIEEVDLPSNYSEVIEGANNAIAYEYPSDAAYTYKGTFTVEGNAIVATYESSSLSTNNIEILDDLARYLGALYRAGGIKEIKWNSNTYAWNPTAAGNLEGSNWWNATTSKTLVKELTTWFASNSDATQVTLNCDGVDMIYKVVVN